jgi:hypothetical protein
MRRRGAVWLAWGICGIPLVLAALIWLLYTKNAAVANPSGEQPLEISPLFDAGVLLVFSIPAALIVSRQPRNPIGWLLAAIGYGVGVADFAGEYGYYALVTAPGALPAAVPVLWLGTLLGIWLTVASVPLLLLLFPDGRLPSRRWRPVAWATLATLTLLLAANALYPRNLGGDPRLPENPTGIHGWESTLDTVMSLSALLFLAFLVVSLTAVAVRFRRAAGVERQQLKWFAYGAMALVLTLIGFVPLSWVGLFALILVGFGLFTACVTVAMLRYHLYDIDRLINRTLTYGLLTIVLGAIYVGAVVLLGQALHPWVGHSALAVAASTLLVAALFQPLRRRIQDQVDRRFNRRRYDAAKTIEAFSARLREQLDLDTLSAELLGVVDRTMQPTRVSLWLRPATRASPDHGDSVAHRAALRPTGDSRSGHLGL